MRLLTVLLPSLMFLGVCPGEEQKLPAGTSAQEPGATLARWQARYAEDVSKRAPAPSTNPQSKDLPPTASAAAAALAPSGNGSPAVPLSELMLLREAITGGKASGFMRYRYEHVEQSDVIHEANASTLLGVLGYATNSYHGLSAFVQFEGVWEVGNDNYRNVSNGKSAADYPLVADQSSVELQQAWVHYVCPKDPWKTNLNYGRQEIALSNQRLVGVVNWRQDRQSFDGAGISTAPVNDGANRLSFSYNYLTQVNRIFPDDTSVAGSEGRLDMNTHLAQGTFTCSSIGQLILYGLFLDYDSEKVSVTNNSSRTMGARLSGTGSANDALSLQYAVEYALQKDYGSNTNAYQAAYFQGELGTRWSDFTLKYGYNILQGDSATDKFTTPLATGHAFNGWADVFLSTPNAGLKGHSLSLDWTPSYVKGLTITATGYEFYGDSLPAHYGSEIDLMAQYKISQFPGLLVGVVFARFIGDEVTAMTGASVTGARAESLSKTMLYTQYSF